VVCVVLRRTRGWQRQRDRISLTHFERQTGMSRKTVMTAIDEAIRRKWITRGEVRTDRGMAYVYEFRLVDDALGGEMPPVEKVHGKEWSNSTASRGEMPPLPVEKLHTQKKGKKVPQKGKENFPRAQRGGAADGAQAVRVDEEAQETPAESRVLPGARPAEVEAGPACGAPGDGAVHEGPRAAPAPIPDQPAREFRPAAPIAEPAGEAGGAASAGIEPAASPSAAEPAVASQSGTGSAATPASAAGVATESEPLGRIRKARRALDDHEAARTASCLTG